MAMKPMTWEKAVLVWQKNPNRMIAFAPNTCQHPLAQADRWVLADRWNILGTGFNAPDLAGLRDMFRRKKG